MAMYVNRDVALHSRVESESGDLERKSGSLFWWVKWVPHLQTKLSGCDLDITCSLEN